MTDERWKRCWVKSIALLANVRSRPPAIPAITRWPTLMCSTPSPSAFG